MATINSAITSVHIGEHNMTRSHAIDFGGERFALLALFNKKGNETTLETFNYILEFWLLFHNNIVFVFRL